MQLSQEEPLSNVMLIKLEVHGSLIVIEVPAPLALQENAGVLGPHLALLVVETEP